MKTLHFVSILVLATAATFACDDSEDRIAGGSAGTKGISGAAGKSGTAGNGGAGENVTAGSANVAGSSGSSAGTTNGGGIGGGGATNTLEGGSGGQDDNAAGMGGAAGGAGGAGEVAQGPLEIIGSWNDSFNGTQTISATDWNGSAILVYDNATNVVYTQYPANDMYSPNKFAKTVYTDITGNSFYFCTLVFNADTLAAAQADAGVANATDPDHTGCGGFSWTKATKQ